MASHEINEKGQEALYNTDSTSPGSDTDSPESTLASESRSPMELIDEGELETLNRIATQSSQRRSSVHADQVTRTPTLATIPEDDPALNPEGPSFDLNKWLKAVLREAEKKGREENRTGIIFKNLTVSGTGAALQFQDTVSSVASAPLRIGDMVKQHRSPPKRILNEFNGLMKSGELLLVLGRPGSGCSTFLKSLCGELHGLSLSKESVIHYDGMSP